MARNSEKSIVRDILRAQGIWEHGDTPTPTPEAIAVLRAYGIAKYGEGRDDEAYDREF